MFISSRRSPTTAVFPFIVLLACMQVCGAQSTPLATPTAAARILDQSTFGPTAAMIQTVEQEGLPAYLNDQATEPPSLIQVSLPTNIAHSALPAYCQMSATLCVSYAWWNNVMTGPDQLRQRVAYALSQIFVVSQDTVWLGGLPYYQNVLVQDAFSNWSTIMNDVSLSPAMGLYLNMYNSGKASTGQIANENFARESLQLFSIGPFQLNMDGTQALDANGNPIPNYTGDQIQAFARAYTGWTTAGTPPPTRFISVSDLSYTAPLEAVESLHDKNAKTLLNGVVLPAGQTAEQDLAGVIDNVFNHPSLPPFICKQLIQHLVTSNPSPAYVSRIANVFVNDGTGVRGNMLAVVDAILLDPEARAGDTGSSSPSFGHLREPTLWLAGVMRGLNATPSVGDASAYQQMNNFATLLAEPIYNAPSVFNFFPPNNLLDDGVTLAPEFGIENTSTVVERLNIADAIVSNHVANETVDLTASGPLGQLAQAGPQQLINQLNLVFMHGSMSSQMNQTILNAISGLTDPAQQVRVAVYLVITSSAYKVAS